MEKKLVVILYCTDYAQIGLDRTEEAMDLFFKIVIKQVKLYASIFFFNRGRRQFHSFVIIEFLLTLTM